MQITLMRNNSTENIIIKQTSENGNDFQAVKCTQKSQLRISSAWCFPRQNDSK